MSTAVPAASASPAFLPALSLGALGVVYGDIGTSPLYAFQSAFSPSTGVPYSAANIAGILSLIFWALLLMVSLKYVFYVLRADNDGEGGILALMALVTGRLQKRSKALWITIAIGLVGASMFYGDSVITPAISVLSAIEGLSVATPIFSAWEVPITAGILVALFTIQRYGTERVGRLFGPIMLVWFAAIALFGLHQILIHPSVMAALNPLDGLSLVLHHPGLAMILLGAVFLVLTGGEALYADMGHFGKRPIQWAWALVVFPALVLNYFGQGALVLEHPEAVKNPFFLMIPHAALWPMLLLATVATVIASQAVISGAYSMTAQAVHLGYLPRIPMIHTNAAHRGQIYIPFINWMLMLFVLALVAVFRNADGLASAYGFAVNVTMLVTTLFCWTVSLEKWQWNPLKSALVWGGFLTVDLAFLASNSLKIPHGGWFPLLFGACVYTTLSTWKRGRVLLLDKLKADTPSVADFLASLQHEPVQHVEGTAVYLTPARGVVPAAFLHNLKHNKVLHERIVFLYAEFMEVPYVIGSERAEVHDLGQGFYSLDVRRGFKDSVDIQGVFADCAQFGHFEFVMNETSFFLARQTILSARRSGMAAWREVIFAWLNRNAQAASDYFKIPPNRVIELGTQIEI